jgi:gamma-polyglutamate biosynthesis protein CapA
VTRARGRPLLALTLGVLLACGRPPASDAPLPTDAGPVRLVFGGDVMFGRYIEGRQRVCGGPRALDAAAAWLRAADLALVNLETAFCAGPPPEDWAADARHLLISPDAAADWLAGWGIHGVSMANNHALDCGVAGLDRTAARLREAGLFVLGLAEPGESPFTAHLVEVRGVRLGLIAATDRWNADRPLPPPRLALARGPRFEVRLREGIASARAQGADVVVVFPHWGRELVSEPQESQRRLARALIDAGADLVVGHGAHKLQPVERYGGGLIAYSLGNLLFDMGAPGTQETAVLEVALVREGERWAVGQHALLPLRIRRCALEGRAE